MRQHASNRLLHLSRTDDQLAEFADQSPGRSLKKTQTAQYSVEKRLKYAGPRSGKLRAHCAFSSILALSCAPREVPLGRTRLSLFLQPAPAQYSVQFRLVASAYSI